MGDIEKRGQKRKKKRDIQRFVLDTVKVTGVLSVAAVAPAVLGAMKKLGIAPSFRQDTSIAKARKRLVEKGLLEYDGTFLRITQKGQQELLWMQLKDTKKEKPRRWDGRWRVLIFDIPEKKRLVRQRIRDMIELIGFIRLQDSVWLYPYDCEDMMTLLKSDLKIGRDMLYLIVDELEYDTPYRRHFNLPKHR